MRGSRTPFASVVYIGPAWRSFGYCLSTHDLDVLSARVGSTDPAERLSTCTAGRCLSSRGISPLPCASSVLTRGALLWFHNLSQLVCAGPVLSSVGVVCANPAAGPFSRCLSVRGMYLLPRAMFAPTRWTPTQLHNLQLLEFELLAPPSAGVVYTDPPPRSSDSSICCCLNARVRYPLPVS